MFFRVSIAYIRKKSKITMCGKIDMEVPFIKYTANYLTVYSEMICSSLSKLHYLSAHNDFGFFSYVGYLPSKLHIKNIKTLFWGWGEMICTIFPQNDC